MKFILVKLVVLSMLLPSVVVGQGAKIDKPIVFENFENDLFRNCLHKLKVVSPSFSPLDSIRYEAIGAELIYYKESNGIVYIKPTGVNPILKIYKNEILIGERKFRSRIIPQPKIEMYADSSLIVVPEGKQNECTLSKKTKLLTLKVEADEKLKAVSPEDAHYKVTSWEVLLKRGNRIEEVIEFKEETGDISALIYKASKGDQIVVSLKGVQRVSYDLRASEICLGMFIRYFLVVE